MARKETHSVEKPAQCVHEDCKSGRIWYHAWYYRKGDVVPCEGERGIRAAGPLAIRRFKCADCGRTFSWRPPFLVFGHRYTVAAYELFVHNPSSRGGDWWQPDASARKAVRRRLRDQAPRVTARLEIQLGHPPSGRADVPEMLRLAQSVAAQQASSHPEHPRCSCHILFLAMACTRSHTSYCLTAA